MLVTQLVFAQQKTLQYNVLNRGNSVGTMQYTQQKNGNKVTHKVTSDVQMRLLVNVKINVQEVSHFVSGKLVSSAVKRYQNDKEKVNKETKEGSGGYITGDDGKLITKRPIVFNVMMLYEKEPVKVDEVYSDNFQQFLKIEPLGNHAYKMKLPEGNNYNIYTYNKGVCSKVEVFNGMYNVEMILLSSE